MNKRVLLAYLKSRVSAIICGAVCVAVTAFVCWIYGESLMPALLSAVILLLLGAILGIIGYRAFDAKHQMLKRGREFPQSLAESFSAKEALRENEDIPDLEEKIDLIEADYRTLLIKLSDTLSKEQEEHSASYNAMLDYYTMWVHQIKTPISALSLIIQNMEDAETGSRLRSQLIQVENYADMALNYLRLGSESNDLAFTKVKAEDVVRSEIKRAMTMFLAKGLTVDFRPFELEVTTDKKWLGFIVGQLISNAIKYQKTGSVHFYGTENGFVIEDEGIGIAPEDLPRIFEKGYTGYNGHNEKKSTGLGLYLVKKAADMISADVVYASEVGKGTKVSVLFGKKQDA
ncbi:MAG: sensor histidine kinase [Clostridiales bacterium]|nr:sensor histidine kinase [Clostridiales bacterium]